jgi:hypothetical protein
MDVQPIQSYDFLKSTVAKLYSQITFLIFKFAIIMVRYY